MADMEPAICDWEDIGAEHPSFYDLDAEPTDYDSDTSWDFVVTYQNTHPVGRAESVATSLALLDRQCCDHWTERDCYLRTGMCCACSDKRPQTESGLYSHYVDGQGWVEGASRWAYYCPGCHDHYKTRVLSTLYERYQVAALKHAIEKGRQSQIRPQPHCKHWQERSCSLATESGNCCACSDRRQSGQTPLYPVYVDGRGWVDETTRWAYYCPGCKDHYETKRDSCSAHLEALVAAERQRIAPERIEEQKSRKPCRHFARWRCALVATAGNCCACSDHRAETESGLYSQYVDGQGFADVATRADHYCPGCKKGYLREKQRKARQRLAKPTEVIEVAKELDPAPCTQPSEGQCSHWTERGCSLTNNPKLCCACSDERPVAPSYSFYIDGEGWVMGASRWSYYCPGCKDYHKLNDTSPPQEITPMKVKEPRRKTYKGVKRFKKRRAV